MSAGDQKTIAAHVAEFVAGTRYEDIPAETAHIAKRHVLDSFACGIAGAQSEGSAIVRRYVEQLGCNGPATIFASTVKTLPRFAALANASAMHADDYDDTYHPTRFHPSAPVLAAVWAEAEAIGASGREVLKAFCVGTEVSCKVSRAIGREHYLRGFHMTSTCGVFGATAGVCSLRGMSMEATLHAIGIAGSQSAGVRENFGTMTKPMHSGRAAESAVFAASLATMGFTSAPTIFEGPRGYFMTGAGAYDAAEIVGRLGNPWSYSAERVAIKPYPCGNLQQPAMDKLRELVLTHDIEPGEVQRLAVKSHRLMPLNLTYHRPKSGLEGKFSMEFSLASLLVLRRAGLAEYSDEVVNRADIQEAIAKIDYTTFSDEEAAAKGYTLLTTFLDITLNDGRTISARADAAKGSASMPLTDEEVAEKFCDAACFAQWPSDRADNAIANLSELEMLADIRALSAFAAVGQKD